jgi:hypothetical protein
VSRTEDPGWRLPLRALIPFVGFKLRLQLAPDGFTAIRTIFSGLVAALPLFAVSLSYVVEKPATPGSWPFAVATVGLLSLLGINLLHHRPLVTTSLGSLAASWRTRSFIGVGIAQIPALVAIALTFATDPLWIYGIGMVLSMVGLWGIAPSKRSLARDQEAIRASGSPLDLTEALMSSGPSASTSPPRLEGVSRG